MGLFGLGKKKKEKKKIEIPSFPEISSAKREEGEEDSGPKYEPTLSSIKKEIGKINELPKENLQIKEDFSKDYEKEERLVIPERKPKVENKHVVSRAPVEEGKPIFVKIENYKGALELIDQIKKKVKEAEKVFEEIEKMREERDKKIDAWKADLNKIKEKLINVDKKLFEV